MSNEMEDAKLELLDESGRLLVAMEAGLLQLEIDPDDEDAINAVFRAAHTIKGSAGIFGFDDIVAFTHVVETLLDQVRNHKLKVDSSLIAVLLNSCDHMGALVRSTVLDGGVTKELLGVSEKLIVHLRELDPSNSIHGENKPALPAQRTPPVTQERGQSVAGDTWHISLRFGREVLRNGMDPLSFLRYLSGLGVITSVITLDDAFPAAEEFDPEACYLGFEIDFVTLASKAEIEQVFDFVKDDCQIRIIPPSSHISLFIELINELPESDMRLGEILVKGGAVTEHELTQMLAYQQSISEPKPTIGEALVQNGLVDKKVVEAAAEKQTDSRKRKLAENKSIRIDADKLDELINLVGELVISSASSYLQAQRSGDDALLESISNTARLIDEIRDTSLRLRMVQIGETFNRFTRVVRDVSRELGKDIRLKIQGAETELDKTVVEKISDPLMHLVRNSMDHGIESAETRMSNGKPAYGTLQLNAYHDAGSIVIEVSDDGGGLNRDRILQKALERGLVTPSQKLSDHDIYQLIFEPGFSTAEQVTNLSGRGVGMDVVRRNIQSLRGTIDIESIPGQGATVRFRLPLTLAIIDGFLVGVGESSYVIPLDMVHECIELDGEMDGRLSSTNYMNLRGEVLPFMRLRDFFMETGGSREHESIVVVHYGNQKAGFVVDTLHGELQTVIKPLGKILQNLQGVSGATILGSGHVAVILDVPNLIQKVSITPALPGGGRPIQAALSSGVGD